ncbi:MAG TPA: MFS transporter [Terrimicrobiaceae bacterium]
MTPDVRRERDARRVLAVVAYALFMDYFIYGLIVPLAPAKVHFEAQMGMLYGAYAMGVLVATPLFAYLAMRVGYRLIMIIGVLLSASSVFLFCAASQFSLVVIARCAEGASAAASWTAGLALIAEYFAARRLKMMGLAMMGSTTGAALGPAGGSWLFSFGGLKLVMVVTMGMVALDALLRIFILPPGKDAPAKERELKALFLDKSVLVASLAVAAAAAGWGVIEPLWPNHLSLHGVSLKEVGILFTVATLSYGLAAPLVSWVSERTSIKTAICIGLLGMAASLPMLAFTNNLVLDGLFLCLIAIFFAFAINPPSAELADAVDRRGLHCYAAIYAVYNISYSLGMIGVDVFAASLANSLSLWQILVCLSGLLFLCVPLVVRLLQRSKAVGRG